MFEYHKIILKIYNVVLPNICLQEHQRLSKLGTYYLKTSSFQFWKNVNKLNLKNYEQRGVLCKNL